MVHKQEERTIEGTFVPGGPSWRYFVGIIITYERHNYYNACYIEVAARPRRYGPAGRAAIIYRTVMVARQSVLYENRIEKN